MSRRIVKKSKYRQNVKKPQGLKSCKDHRFGGTFTEAPIFRQRTRTSVRALTVFRALFYWVQKLSQYHIQSDYHYGKANGAADALSRFFPEKPRSSLSREHSSLSPAVINSPFASSFYQENARLPSATLVLEMRSGRRRPSPESGRRCLMAERMLGELSRPVLRS